MSYILDALRKAERERGIKQVPTLMTEHAPRTANRNRVWVILGVLVVCAAVVAWYFADSQKGLTPQSASSTVTEYNRMTREAGTSQDTASDIAGNAPPAIIPLQNRANQNSEQPPEKSGGINPTSGIQSAHVPSSIPPKKAAEILRRASQPEEEESLTSQEEEQETIVPPPEVIRSRQRPNPGAASSGSAPSQPATLQEAISKMTLSLLFYADAKAERMVYIDGTKYVEGEYVDGIYLLESITVDGAILSYRGERAMLHPKSK